MPDSMPTSSPNRSKRPLPMLSPLLTSKQPPRLIAITSSWRSDRRSLYITQPRNTVKPTEQ